MLMWVWFQSSEEQKMTDVFVFNLKWILFAISEAKDIIFSRLIVCLTKTNLDKKKLHCVVLAIHSKRLLL